MEEYILDLINFFVGKNTFFVYVLFFISSFTQIVFPPYPGDVVLIFQGYVTVINSSYNIYLIYINAMLGTMAGSLLLYHLGYKNGEKVFQYKLVNKFISHKNWNRGRKLFEEYGVMAIFISKFIPGVNAIIIILSGVFKTKRYLAYTGFLLSTIVHHFVLVIIGRFLGNNMDYVKNIIHTYNVVIMLTIGVLGCAFLLYKFRLKKIKG